MKNVTLISCRLLLAAAIVTTAGALAPATAQTGTPPPVTGPVPEPTAVPIDGGAGLLLAGGVAYGLRQLRQRRKK